MRMLNHVGASGSFRRWVVGLVVAGSSALGASSATAGPVSLFQSRQQFNAAVAGPVAVEDFEFTGFTGLALNGPLDAQTDQPGPNGTPGIRPGDVVPGVRFSAPNADLTRTEITRSNFAINHGGIGSFDGSFLSTIRREGDPVQPLEVAFDGPAAAFGFETRGLYAAPDFTVTLRFTSGEALTRRFEFSESIDDDAEVFVGFRSDSGTADIAGARLDFSSGQFEASIDNFAFTTTPTNAIPLPPAVWSGLAALATGALLRRRATA
jgi:hypothetical protein